MPVLKNNLAEGAWVDWDLVLDEDLSEAVEVRVDHEHKDETGAWIRGSLTEADGLILVGDSTVRVTQKDLVRGPNSLWVYARFTDGWVLITPDPVQFTVTVPGKRA